MNDSVIPDTPAGLARARELLYSGPGQLVLVCVVREAWAYATELAPALGSLQTPEFFTARLREHLARRWHQDPPAVREWLVGECWRYVRVGGNIRRFLLGEGDERDTAPTARRTGPRH